MNPLCLKKEFIIIQDKKGIRIRIGLGTGRETETETGTGTGTGIGIGKVSGAIWKT